MHVPTMQATAMPMTAPIARRFRGVRQVLLAHLSDMHTSSEKHEAPLGKRGTHTRLVEQNCPSSQSEARAQIVEFPCATTDAVSTRITSTGRAVQAAILPMMPGVPSDLYGDQTSALQGRARGLNRIARRIKRSVEGDVGRDGRKSAEGVHA